MHLLGGPLEESTASAPKQGIASKDHPRGRRVVGHGTQGMPGYVQTAQGRPGDLDLLPVLNRSGLMRDPFLLLVVGYPAGDATVPDIGRKALADIASFR